MNKETSKWVTFYSPGSFTANTYNKDRQGDDSPHMIEWPVNAYAFTLHEREDVIDGNSIYKGKVRKIGPEYWHPNSKVEALEQVKRNPEASKTLIINMECNKWEYIIWTRWGNWPQEFNGDKIVVLEGYG